MIECNPIMYVLFVHDPLFIIKLHSMIIYTHLIASKLPMLLDKNEHSYMNILSYIQTHTSTNIIIVPHTCIHVYTSNACGDHRYINLGSEVLTAVCG